jgi:uncharacterized protein
MSALVDYVVRSIVKHPDEIRLNTVEGEASSLVELTVHPDDVALVLGPEGDTLRALRTVLSASAGQRKVVLELVDTNAPASSEE